VNSNSSVTLFDDWNKSTLLAAALCVVTMGEEQYVFTQDNLPDFTHEQQAVIQAICTTMGQELDKVIYRSNESLVSSCGILVNQAYQHGKKRR